jgi:hypothetical protein
VLWFGFWPWTKARLGLWLGVWLRTCESLGSGKTNTGLPTVAENGVGVAGEKTVSWTGETGTERSFELGSFGAAIEDVMGAKSPGPQALGHLDSGWLSAQPFWQTWLYLHALPSRSAAQGVALCVRESQTVGFLLGGA